MGILKKINNIFSGKKGQTNPGAFTRVATHVQRHTSDRGTYFLFLAFIIFLVDLSTSFFGIFPLGPRYAGFQWVWGLDFINILTNIVTSSIFGIFVLFFLIIKVARRDWKLLAAEAVSFAIFAIVMTFFLLNNNWIGTPKAIIHLVFVLLFAFTFIRANEDAPAFYILTTFLLLLDFFGYTLLSNIVILRYIPFLLIFVIFYIYGKNQNSWSIIFVILLLIVLFVFAYKDLRAQGTNLSFIAQTDAPTFEDVKNDFSKGLRNIYGSWQVSLQQQIQYAITGKVEENQHEPIGVYIDRVQSAEPKYYEGEDVVVWGSVRARTLDDPINIQVGCFIKDGSNKIKTKTVDPELRFPVFTLEDQDFACTFKYGDFMEKLKAGSKTITAFADFNFETLASLRVYFINRDRLRAMTSEGQDVYEQFGIKDKKPLASYTNGPAEIGMETSSPLIAVADNYIVFPRLSLSVQNRPGWEGKITGLRELVLLFPKGAEITAPDTNCNRKFERYELPQCQSKSCGDLMYNECISVCEGYKKSQSEKESCERFCNEKLSQCNEECEFLFNNDGQEYVGYALAESEIKKITSSLKNDDDYERFKFFSCRFNPVPNKILEKNSPIAIKTIAAKARYNYILEKPVSISVNKDPSKERTTKPGGVGIKGLNEVQNLIFQAANEKGVDPSLAVAIVDVESGFRHCCQDSGNVRGNNCVATTEKTCPADRILKSSDGSSVGIMQVNINNNPQWTRTTFDYGCAGQTIYDLECNIKLGVGLLKEKYDLYKNGLSENYFRTTSDNVCQDEKYISKYASYRDWWAAARGYHGWACRNEVEANYVEKVQESYGKVGIGQLPQGGFTAVGVPTDLTATYISNYAGAGVWVSWNAPQNANVDSYLIYKSTFSPLGKISETINAGSDTAYFDYSIVYNTKYSYSVASVSGSDLSSPSNSGEITIKDQKYYEDVASDEE